MKIQISFSTKGLWLYQKVKLKNIAWSSNSTPICIYQMFSRNVHVQCMIIIYNFFCSLICEEKKHVSVFRLTNVLLKSQNWINTVHVRCFCCLLDISPSYLKYSYYLFGKEYFLYQNYYFRYRLNSS